MRYVIANRVKSAKFGISATGHKTKDKRILLNEKEVVSFVAGESFEEKVVAVDGVSYSATEVKQVLKREGWK